MPVINEKLPKILLLHGHDDPLAPPEDVHKLQQELTSSQADWQIHIYGNTMHAFTNPLANDLSMGTVYKTSADKRSWQSIIDFLSEVFNDE